MYNTYLIFACKPLIISKSSLSAASIKSKSFISLIFCSTAQYKTERLSIGKGQVSSTTLRGCPSSVFNLSFFRFVTLFFILPCLHERLAFQLFENDLRKLMTCERERHQFAEGNKREDLSIDIYRDILHSVVLLFCRREVIGRLMRVIHLKL